MTKKKNDTDFEITLPKGKRKPRKKRGQKSYTTQEIQEVLVILDGNQGNMSKTSRDTGIPLSTIKSWKLNHSVEKYQEQGGKSAEIVAKTRSDIEGAWNEMVLSHLPKFDESVQKALERAIDLITVEKDLDKVTRYLETLSKVMPKPVGDSPVVNNIQQFVQNIQNNYDKELS